MFRPTAAFVLLSFAFRLPFVCLSFCFRFAFVMLSFCFRFAERNEKAFRFRPKIGQKRKAFSFRKRKGFSFPFLRASSTFRLRASISAPPAACGRTTNCLMRGPNSGSRPTRSDGGRPQREAAARSPHGCPRPVRSPRAARSPRIRAPTSAPSTAEQQPAPLARIVDFGEWREEDLEAASAQRRRRRRDAHEDEFEARAAPRPNARWREQWRIVMVDIAMGPLPAHLNSRGARSAPLALDPDAQPCPESLAQTPPRVWHSPAPPATCLRPTGDVQRLGSVRTERAGGVPQGGYGGRDP